MEPIWIFNKDEVLVATLGDAPQGCPYYEAVHHEVLNGVNKLEFTIPGDHPVAGLVEKGCIAVIQTIEGDFRAFRVKRHIQGFGEGGARYRQIYAEDIAVDELNAAPVIDRRPNNPLDALIGALENSLWEVGQVDGGFPKGSTNFYHETSMSCLQKMAETWGGEFRFRINHDGKRITGRYVDFLRPVGTDTGFRVTVGKNLRELEGEEDITALATALYGYGRGEEHEETGGFGRRVSFADVEWKVENGDPVDKPLGQEWVGDPEALAVWGFQGGTVHRFDFVIFEDIEDPEELLRLTWEELQRRKAPQVNYRVKMVDLEHTEGRSFEAMRVGYWATVIDDDFKPPLEFKARVIEKITPINNPENAEIVLGQEIMTLQDAVNRAAREASRAVKAGDPISLLDSTFQTLTDELHRTPGYVYFTPTDGLLVTDRPKDQHPTSAIQLKGGMLAIADEWDAAKNDFNWRAFGTGKGFVADLITAGTLDASLVKISTTAAGGDGSREITLYNGRVTSYFDGQKTIEMGGSNLYLWPYLPNSGGTGEDEAGVIYGVRWRDNPVTDGVAISGRHFVGLALMRPDKTGEPILVADKNLKNTTLAGPASASASDLAALALRADSRLVAEGRVQPSIWIGRGNIGSTSVANVEVYVGDPTRSNVPGEFTVYQNTSSGSTLLALFEKTAHYIPLQNTDDSRLFLDLDSRIERSGTHFRIIAGQGYISIRKSDGRLAIVQGGVETHAFNPDGTKKGGSIEIDGVRWGMSPIDSPRVLISDLMLGVDVTEGGTLIELDERLGKAMASYTVFANKPVEISDIEKFSFKVSGYTGKVDLLILGIRADYANQYFEKMGVEKEPPEPVEPPEPALPPMSNESGGSMMATAAVKTTDPRMPRFSGEMAPAEVIKKRRAQNEKTR